MSTDVTLRQHLLDLLRGGNAHMPFDAAVADFPMEHINTQLPHGAYTPWQLIEHMRLTQRDILEFMTNPQYQEPTWPLEYWPPRDTMATPALWQATIDGFHADLAALAVYHARLLLAEGKTGRAAKAVERAWTTAPHPDLAQLYGEIGNTETPLARVTRFQRLAAQNRAARESHLALAEATHAAELWGEARRHLERALAADPPSVAALPTNSGAPSPPLPAIADEGDILSRATPRLCLMMAQIEEAEHGDSSSTREWLDRAVRALPDPRYVCANCRSESAQWHSLCPSCGAFDTLAWRTPAWTGPAAIGVVTVENPPPPTLLAPEPALPAVDAVVC